jgi:hypothetical protein
MRYSAWDTTVPSLLCLSLESTPNQSALILLVRRFLSCKEHLEPNVLSRIVRNLGSSGIVWISIFIPLSQSWKSQVTPNVVHCPVYIGLKSKYSILVHPLTREQVSVYIYRLWTGNNNLATQKKWVRSFLSCTWLLNCVFRDHEIRNAWIGPSFPLDLSTLPLKSEEIPLQYSSLSIHAHTMKYRTVLILHLQNWVIPQRHLTSLSTNAAYWEQTLNKFSEAKRKLPGHLLTIDCTMGSLSQQCL